MYISSPTMTQLTDLVCDRDFASTNVRSGTADRASSIQKRVYKLQHETYFAKSCHGVHLSERRHCPLAAVGVSLLSRPRSISRR